MEQGLASGYESPLPCPPPPEIKLVCHHIWPVLAFYVLNISLRYENVKAEFCCLN